MQKLRCKNHVSFEKFNKISRAKLESTVADDFLELIRSFLCKDSNIFTILVMPLTACRF